MFRPLTGAATGGEEIRQLASSIAAQGDQINGLAPCRRFLGAAGLSHLANDRRKYLSGMLPADQIETLESLVYEVERVPTIRVCAVRLGSEE